MCPIDPCGTIVDFTSHCFSYDIQPWTDSPLRQRVRLYRPPPHTPILPFPTVFGAIFVWADKHKTPPPMIGSPGSDTQPNTYSKGEQPPGVRQAANVPCGSPAAWLGTTRAAAPPLEWRTSGYSTCCLPSEDVNAAVGRRVEVDDERGRVDAVLAPLGRVVRLVDVRTVAEAVRLSVGRSGPVLDVRDTLDTIHLGRGVRCDLSDARTVADAVRASRGVVVRTSDARTLDDAVQASRGIRGLVLDLHQADDVVQASRGVRTTLTDSFTPGTLTPSTTCAAAPLAALSTTYSGTSNPASPLWYKFTGVNGHTYTVTVTEATAFTVAFFWQDGTCSSLNTRLVQSNGGTGSFTLTTGTDIYLKVSNSSGSGTAYTVRIVP